MVVVVVWGEVYWLGVHDRFVALVLAVAIVSMISNVQLVALFLACLGRMVSVTDVVARRTQLGLPVLDRRVLLAEAAVEGFAGAVVRIL